jgi:hypothetical protein
MRDTIALAMDKPRPTVGDMMRRLDAMEAAIHRMLAAFKEDLDSLREDLRRLDSGPPRRTTPPPRSPIPSPRPAGQKRTISEEIRAQKKDPRSD